MVSSATGFASFDTLLGTCAVAWSADGLLGVQLPEVSALRTRDRLARRFPDALPLEPPPAVQQAIAAMQALLQGTPNDLLHIALDLHGVPAFHQRVYALARAILPGATRTYGDLATELGDPSAARAVGQALGQNPFPIVVPCHRVLAARGAMGGFSANGGVETKRRMLAIEGAFAIGELPLFRAAEP